MLSGCAFKNDAQRAEEAAPTNPEDSVESFEFFIWSRGSFIATFAAMYLFSPSLNAELRHLLSGRIDNKCALLAPPSPRAHFLRDWISRRSPRDWISRRSPRD